MAKKVVTCAPDGSTEPKLQECRVANNVCYMKLGNRRRINNEQTQGYIEEE